jgi:galactose-1-phosphate uridylyltransferase
MVRLEYHNLMHEMPDGTLKMTNPLTGRTAWWVPGRGDRPNTPLAAPSMEHGQTHEPEDYCAFCPVNLFQTPPEIERRVQDGNGYRSLWHPLPQKIRGQSHAFRRVANLYEIVTLNYWRRNYDYRGVAMQREWAEAYKSDPDGREHLLALMRMKHGSLKAAGVNVPTMSDQQLLAEADSFFFGCHQLILGERHYRRGASYGKAETLHGSGAFTPDEHHEYVRFTAAAIKEIYDCNRYVRYVATFQNWLRPSGASVDHLHQQLVGLDDWGTMVSREVEITRGDPNFYNAFVVNFAGYNNLVIAENEHAILFADIGHRSPTLAVFSKAKNLRPFEHTPEELRGVSDLVHACHAAQGSSMSCNEEWYYQPRDCLVPIPFHIYIKWRVNNPAGFEGGTSIFINPLRPIDVRDRIVPDMFRLRAEGRISQNIRIAEECPVEPNSLKYNR